MTAITTCLSLEGDTVRQREDGISYTEMEYDYAVEKGLRVIALLHGEPETIPVGKSDTNPDLQERLVRFREKVASGRLVKFWKSSGELPGLVALSLQKTIKTYPAVGWVRADRLASEDLMMEVERRRQMNAAMREELYALKSEQANVVDDIADFDSEISIHGTYRRSSGRRGETVRSSWETRVSWRRLFALLAPSLLEHPSSSTVQSVLAKALAEVAGKSGHGYTMDDQEFKTIMIQLKAYGLISTRYSNTIRGDSAALFWSLTKKGERAMVENRVVRTGGASAR